MIVQRVIIKREQAFVDVCYYEIRNEIFIFILEKINLLFF
jgi:hypothetical protein